MRVARRIVFMFGLVALAGPAHAGLPGDVDVDCDVDIADAVLLERSLAGFVTLTDEQAANANIAPTGGTKDAVVDVADLVTIKRIVTRDQPPETPLATPSITSVTGSNPVLVEGDALPDSTVTLYVNGRRHPYTVTAEPDGDFVFDGTNGFFQVPLVDGENRITVVASTNSGANQSCSSALETVDFDAPTLSNPPAAITSNTVWTPGSFDGQPVDITSNFVVPANKALFIQPGVVLRFSGGTKLQVASGGDLQILGAAAQKVQLGPTGACNASTRWDGIEVLSSPGPRNRISHAVIDCVDDGVRIGSGSAAGSLTLEFSEVKRWTGTGVIVNPLASAARIIDNVLVDSPGSRAIESYSTGAGSTSIEIIDNDLSVNGGTATTVVTLGAKPDVFRGNSIRGGTNYGIFMYNSTGTSASWPTSETTLEIRENTITENCNGVWKSTSFSVDVDLHFNNIHDNDNCSCTSPTQQSCTNYTTGIAGTPSCNDPPPAVTLDATDNWWGTTDVNAIESNIHGWCAQSAPIDFVTYLDAPFDQGGVPVGGENLLQGEISGTLAAGEWIVLGTATVGTSLTIEDGATLAFGENAELVVTGTLAVENELPTTPVTFTALPGVGATPAPGDWKGVTIQGGGAATIADAVIEYAKTALKVTGSGSTLDLGSSLVESFSQAGIRIENASANIHDNRSGGLGIFAAPGKDGIVVADVDAGPGVTIDNNEIRNGLAGVRITNASPVLRGNLIASNNFGVYVGGTGSPLLSKQVSPAIPGNEITANCWGIYVDSLSAQPEPTVTYNKIHANSTCPNSGANYHIAAYGAGGNLDLDAENNWWGGNPSTAASIAGSITDRTDAPLSSNLPVVDFVPFFTTSAMTTTDPGNYLLGPVSSSGSDVLAPGTYKVPGALIVPSSAVWRIGPGATLDFLGNHRILVQGDLEILGEPGSGATLKPATGVASWMGILASGPNASVDIQYATISNANTAVRVEGTEEPVSITDSMLSSFSYGIYLDDVNPTGGAAQIAGNTIDNSSGGTGITVIDSTADIVDNEIRDLSVGISIAGDSDATIGTSPAAGNLIEDFTSTGILFSGVGAQGSVEGNTIVNTFADQKGQGIELVDSSPTIAGNTISETYFGIHVYADSHPMIGEDNVITDNVWGILLRGKRYPNPPSNPADHRNPDPVILRNDLVNQCADAPANCSGSPLGQADLCPKTGGNICVSGYEYDADLVIDARENYWGTIDEGEIRDTIWMEDANPVPLDFSDYLDDAGGSPVTTAPAAFTNVFQDVTLSKDILRPTLVAGDGTQISFDLTSAATNVNVRIYEEAVGGALVKSFSLGSLAAGGPHSVVWDGKDSSAQLLPDNAYRFEIEATQGGVTHLYKLKADGSIVGSAGEHTSGGWNAHRNEYNKVVVFNNYGPPMRAIMRIDDGPGMTEVGPTLLTRLLAANQRRLFVFDGRDHTGAIIESPSPAASDNYVIGFHGQTKVVRNAIFVQDTAPSIFGASYVAPTPPAPPTISNVEVQSDPYLANPTYDQISTIRFKLDQPANVTVKMLKPGVKDASNPADVVAVLDVVGTGLDKSAVWLGYDDSAASESEVVQATTAGSYTFFIEAQHPTQSNLKTTYRGTIQVRLAPGM